MKVLNYINNDVKISRSIKESSNNLSSILINLYENTNLNNLKIKTKSNLCRDIIRYYNEFDRINKIIKLNNISPELSKFNLIKEINLTFNLFTKKRRSINDTEDDLNNLIDNEKDLNYLIDNEKDLNDNNTELNYLNDDD